MKSETELIKLEMAHARDYFDSPVNMGTAYAIPISFDVGKPFAVRMTNKFRNAGYLCFIETFPDMRIYIMVIEIN
ncbi:MAG: hypothetical protein ABIN89_10090 [Chitinophagaceae bacterium]